MGRGGDFSGEGGAAVIGEDEGFEVQSGGGDPGVDADGGLAAGLEEFEEAALGGDAGEGFGVVEGGEGGGELGGFLPSFEGDGALAGGGEEVGGVEDGEVEGGGEVEEGLAEEVEAEEAGAGEDEGVDGGIFG